MHYEITYGPHFIDAQKRLASDKPLWLQVHKLIGHLAEGDWLPGMERKRVGSDPQRPLCEVRLNDGDRMIYEGPLRLDFESERKPAIWIHEVGRHDDINAMIKRALGYIPSEETAWQDDSVIEETPLADRQCWWFPWTALIDFASFESLQESLASAIKLSPRQLEAIRNPYPLLIQGQAGSGKTVLLCHHMATRLDEDKRQKNYRRRLYISYSDRLIERAQRDVSHIMKLLYISDVPYSNTEFLSHEKLLRKYVMHDEDRFPSSKRISWPEFRSLFLANSSQPKAELAWHAIRAFFKGSCRPGVNPPLKQEHFEQLPVGQRPFDIGQFNDLYQVALQYQRWLERHGYWDDLDLARAALVNLQTDAAAQANIYSKVYSEVYCDEGQDLTLVDYEVLIRLCRVHDDDNVQRPGLVVAADPFQTIHPSGFRWTSVKDLIFGVIQQTYNTQLSLKLTPLADNYRCTYEIVRLANALLQLRSRFGPDESIPEQRATGPQKGRPLLVEASNLNPELRHPSPGTAIIVADFDAKQQLQNQGIPDDMLFTIIEAKGLEFENVVAWHLFDSHDELWSIITKEITRISEASRIRVVYLLNTIYVGVTRAMAQLILIETPAGVSRCCAVLGSYIEKLTPEELKRNAGLKQESTLKEWREWAEILFSREDYTRAATAYERANEQQNVDKCRAHEARVRGQHAEAAKLFERSGDSPMALEMYYLAGLWDDVIRLGPQVGLRGARYVARAWYEMCEAGGRADESLVHLERTIKNGVETDAEWLRRAAKRHEEFNRYEESALLWNRVGEYERAGDCFVRIQRWEEAVAAFTQAGSRTTARHLAEGELALSSGEYDKAVESFRRAQAWDRMLVATDGGGLPSRLEALKRLGRHQDALEEAERQRRKAHRDGDERTTTQLDREKMEILTALQRWGDALKLAEELNDFKSALKFAEREGAEPKVISRIRIRIAKNDKNWQLASNLARETGSGREADEYQARAYESEGRYDDAADTFIGLGFLSSAWQVLSQADSSGRYSRKMRWLSENTNARESAARQFMTLVGRNPNLSGIRSKNFGDEDRKALEEVIKILGAGSQEVFQSWDVQRRTWLLRNFREIAERHKLREENPLIFIRSYLERDTILNEGERRELARELGALDNSGYLDKLLSPLEIARAWETSHSYKNAAEAYRSLADSSEVTDERVRYLEAALRMREAQREYHRSANEADKASSLDRMIARLREELSREQDGSATLKGAA